MTVRVRPLEGLNLLALAVLSGLTVAVWRRLADPEGILLRYGVMAIGLLLAAALVARQRGLWLPLRVAVDFYPAAFVPLLFESLGPLIPAARGGARDKILIAADRALLGVDATVWLERFVRPFWNDFFYLAYATYYFLPLILGGLLWARHPPVARRYIFTLSFCFYVSYAGYFTVPALGPRFALADRQTVALETSPLSRSIARTIDELERTKLDVFPSGHTMVTAAVLLVASRRARPVFWALLPVGTALVFSTVYCRYHYVVDVLAGLLLALLSVPLGDRLYDRLASRASEAQPVPDAGAPLLQRERS
jgi:membrane-associated phospholipid phosphatase